MILAAGRGERLLPLTASVPKPLLEIGGESLLERHLHRLKAAGFDEIVINVSHLGEQIEARVGDGARFGVRVAYSREPGEPLETAGGIVAALPLLGRRPFLVINADIWTEYPFERLPRAPALAHLVLVPNPPHHPGGDFDLDGDRLVRRNAHAATYAGLGVYNPDFFIDLPPGRRALGPLLFHYAAHGLLSGELFRGRWFDIGTRARLEEAVHEVTEGSRT
jgi:N-acetyl-alpha-D-muramate 1-phosphate uridylyltransferase